MEKIRKIQKYLSLIAVLAAVLSAVMLTACGNGTKTAGAFDIIGKWEYEKTSETESAVWASDSYVDATRTAEVKIDFNFDADGAFTLHCYNRELYSGYDEEYADRIDADDLEDTDEYYMRGTYTVDGEKINFVVTGYGNIGEGDETEWNDYDEDNYNEMTGCITLNSNIFIGEMIFIKK